MSPTGQGFPSGLWTEPQNFIVERAERAIPDPQAVATKTAGKEAEDAQCCWEEVSQSGLPGTGAAMTGEKGRPRMWLRALSIFNKCNGAGPWVFSLFYMMKRNHFLMKLNHSHGFQYHPSTNNSRVCISNSVFLCVQQPHIQQAHQSEYGPNAILNLLCSYWLHPLQEEPNHF